MIRKNILVSIFHKDGKCNDNFEHLKKIFKTFDIYIPRVDFYGNKWRETKKYFSDNGYDSLFLICSDVSIVCGDVINKIQVHANDENMGVYSFGTINNCTFPWLRYDNIHLNKRVPFIEGYCFGINKSLFKYLQLDTIYGYGIDVEIGYRANVNGLKCIVDNEVCISHQYGKSYSDEEATKEYRSFLLKYPEVQKYLNDRNIFHPLLLPNNQQWTY